MVRSRTIWSPSKATVQRMAALMAAAFCILLAASPSQSTPANRIGMDRYFDRFLAKKLNACTTCHLPLAAAKSPDSLANFPHNAFGARLAVLGEELRKQHKRSDIVARLKITSSEDSDGDRVD